jgi:uncharacterized phage-associated protein
MSYLKLLKLLYLADRRCLLERGNTITGDCFVCMPHGPVLSQTYDAIRIGGNSEWDDVVEDRADREVALKDVRGVWDELSPYELRVLDAIYDQFGHMSRWAIRDYTHSLPEWRDPQGSSLPIDPAQILRDEGKSPELIEDFVADAEQAAVFDRLIASR